MTGGSNASVNIKTGTTPGILGRREDASDMTPAWTIYSCGFSFYDIAKSDLRYSIAVRWQARRRTARQPAYVATSDSTAHPRITAA